MVIFHCYVSSPEGKGEWFFKSILQILWDLGSRRDIQIFQTSWPRFRGDCSWLQVTLILHCKILDPWKDMRKIATYYAILYIAVEHCSCMFKANPARCWSTLPPRSRCHPLGRSTGQRLELIQVFQGSNGIPGGSGGICSNMCAIVEKDNLKRSWYVLITSDWHFLRRNLSWEGFWRCGWAAGFATLRCWSFVKCDLTGWLSSHHTGTQPTVAIALPPRRKECHNPIYHARANLPTLSWGFGKLLKRLTGCGHGVWMLPMQPSVEEKGKDSWGSDVAASPNDRRFAWPLFAPFSFRHCHAAGQIVFGNFFGGCCFFFFVLQH